MNKKNSKSAKLAAIEWTKLPLTELRGEPRPPTRHFSRMQHPPYSSNQVAESDFRHAIAHSSEATSPPARVASAGMIAASML